MAWWNIDRVLTKIAQADLFLNSSLFEGGANAVCEAIALGTPVLATRIPGNVGILGSNYPGLFATGDVTALTSMLMECEKRGTFLGDLEERCSRISATFAPKYESQLWAELLSDLCRKACHTVPT